MNLRFLTAFFGIFTTFILIGCGPGHMSARGLLVPDSHNAVVLVNNTEDLDLRVYREGRPMKIDGEQVVVRATELQRLPQPWFGADHQVMHLTIRAFHNETSEYRGTLTDQFRFRKDRRGRYTQHLYTWEIGGVRAPTTQERRYERW